MLVISMRFRRKICFLVKTCEFIVIFNGPASLREERGVREEPPESLLYPLPPTLFVPEVN